LYNIYSLNLTPHPTSETKVIVFADDIIIYSSHANLAFAAYRTQCAMNKLINNASSLHLQPSAPKSSTVVVSLRPFNSLDATLACNNNPIPVPSETENLGIISDSKLTWKAHIEDLLLKIGPSLNILRMLSSVKWGSDPVIMTTFYKAFIRSKIDYGSTLYGTASNVHFEELDRIQNKCLRFIIGVLQSTPVPALCAETVIPPSSIPKKLPHGQIPNQMHVLPL